MSIPVVPLPLRDRTMPVPFTLGWMVACLDVFGGSGGVPAILSLAFQERFPDLTAVPLYSYYRHIHGHTHYLLHPVDYWFFTEFCHHIQTNYGRRRVASLTRQIGVSWWMPQDASLFTSYIPYTLHQLIGLPMIQVYQSPRLSRMTVIEDIPETSQSQYQAFVYQACLFFSQQMHNQADITCSVDVTATGIHIHIPICPFCDKDTSNCLIFAGILDAMFRWFWHQTQTSVMISPAITQSDDHHIDVQLFTT